MSNELEGDRAMVMNELRKGRVAELPSDLSPLSNGQTELCALNWGRLLKQAPGHHPNLKMGALWLLGRVSSWVACQVALL
jgi:hypothetical protein